MKKLIVFCLIAWSFEAYATVLDRLLVEKIPSDTSIVWHEFGVGMSGNNKIAYWHPTNPKVLYISPNMGVAYVSFDGGHSYQNMYDEDEGSIKDGLKGPDKLSSIDFSRKDENFGYCTHAYPNGIMLTKNMGRSWKKLSNADNIFGGAQLSCITVDPKDDNVWYVGAGHMRNLGKPMFPKSHPHGLFDDAKSMCKIWKSIDKGHSWTLINKGLDSKAEVETIKVDPEFSNIVYASTNYGFYKSTNAGKTWVKKTLGMDNDVMMNFCSVYHKGTLTLYVINNVQWKVDGTTIADNGGGIFRSDDRGDTWHKVSDKMTMDMSHWQNDKAITTSYYHAMAYYFGMSDNAFAKKYPILPKQITPRSHKMEVDPNDPNNIYAINMYTNASKYTFKPATIWRSKNGGKDWYITFRNGKNWNTGKDIAYWKAHHNPIGTNVSFRYLREWINREPYDLKSCNFTKFNCDGTILHTQNAKISLMSYDKGDTWVDIDDEFVKGNNDIIVGAGNSNVPGHGFYQSDFYPGTVFCTAGENGYCNTVDGGSSVRKGEQAVETHRILPGEHSGSCFAVDPKDKHTFYITFFRQYNSFQLVRSLDAGKSWEVVGDIFDRKKAERSHQLDLTIDPNNTQNMYLCVPYKGLDIALVGNSDPKCAGFSKSQDGGVHWRLSNTGLPQSHDVTHIALDPKNSNIIYASVQGKDGGLFMSKDKGDSWLEVNSTLPISKNQGINDIHFDVDGNAYITSGSPNGGMNDGGLYRSTDNLKSWTKIFNYPWTYRVETAKYNPNIIMLSTLPCKTIKALNVGAYLSKDGGKSWIKINKGNAQSDRINDIAINNSIQGTYYISTYGSGWYIAKESKKRGDSDENQ